MALRAPIRWTEYAHLRFTNRDPDKPDLNKERTAELIARLGVRGPKVYGVFSRIQDIDFDALPDRFVLKPTGLSGKRGVMLLERRPRATFWGRLLGAVRGVEPHYWDAMLRRKLTVAEIIAEQIEWRRFFLEKRRKTLNFIVEDMITPETNDQKRPREYKVYTFAGEPALIVQYTRTGDLPAVAFFDGSFAPIHEQDGKVLHGKEVRIGRHVAPKCAKEILDGAARVSLALRTPFIRVDFYAAREGAVLGELTVATGGPYRGATYRFTKAFDLEMGRRWTEALERLGRPAPVYDDRWTRERRRTSGLPIKLASVGRSGAGAAGSAPKPALRLAATRPMVAPDQDSGAAIER